MFNQEAYIMGLEITVEGLKDQKVQLQKEVDNLTADYKVLKAEIRQTAIERNGEA